MSVVGVAAALANEPPTRSILSSTQLLLIDRVAIVTGGHRNIGLDMALALAEAGATVYCVDLPALPDADWRRVKEYVTRLPEITSTLDGAKAQGRLEYMTGDVTDQHRMWEIAEEVVKREGRLDICVANAGVMGGVDCLDYTAEEARKMMDVNINGAFFTAQAAGRQMEKLGMPGSIIMTASISGSIANCGQHWAVYNTSKAGVIQMTRSLACELGPKGIRVNSISPGYINTRMTEEFLDARPHLRKQWIGENPLGRLGRPDELRGVTLWLASDASTFCTGSNIVVDGGHRAW
ncbi:NAD(P)-binding protein [Macrolepiota fuliginosa MF-IS2]|uniref:NAD(P)-binding protein n=1 Tax=Macrolepiota fuliginosa MF-IS2 TaxID=1400762 RepID=A0A9P6C0I0_9AGAR|nr:NAD(P)-binding protein [Macrolepiota fuliginosa MF-IS2]